MASEKVNPIIVRDDEMHAEYTLEFNRESVKFAESRGFDLEDVGKYALLKVPELWFYAFRMHHKKVAREKTDKLLDEISVNGIPEGLVARLIELYTAPYEAFFGTEDDVEGDEKNSSVTVQF